MSQRIYDLYKKYVLSDDTPPSYGLIYFDHIASEYQILRPSIDAGAQELLDKIEKKRGTGELDWDDIYTFDLMLLEYLPQEYLVRKAFSLRSRYRNVAGQLAYDAYIASKPPDLGTLFLEEVASPPSMQNMSELILKADIRFLLGEFHLLYAVMPERETLRAFLIKRTLYVLTPVLILGFLSLFVGPLLSLLGTSVGVERVERFQPSTLGVVAFVGVIGGFLSVLQRIQSSPSEGDAIYNLAAITHGTWSIYLSPFSGGIFAILLYIIFAAGILQGTIIPDLTSDNTQNERTTPTGNTNASALPASQTGATGGGANANQSVPAANSKSATGESLSLKEFLLKTGPIDPSNYALLILWSFLAGFAERLVPDTLNRLVAKQANQSGQT